MFCPQCRAEYRQGFYRCADCDVDLVSDLPTDIPPAVLRAGEFCTIWAGDSEETCVALCLELKGVGIPYTVAQNVKSRGGRMSVIWRYELAVPADAVDQSRKLLDLPDTVVEESSELTEEDEKQALLEYPDGEEIATDEERNRDAYLSPWYPEDATIEIWSRPADDGSTMVEMSLKENCIRARVAIQDDGSTKYFVMPDDEASARVIVRQIVQDSPGT